MKNLGELPVWFLKQKRSSQWIIGGLGLFLLFGLCILFSAIITRFTQQAPAITATYPGASNLAFITWTPAMTSTPLPTSTPTLTASPVPTRTPLPTGLPTQSFDTPTVVVLPTGFLPSTSRPLVVIVYVDTELQYADIQNVGTSPVSLSGWVLVSETGNQSCPLKGILQSQQILRIWAGTNPVGFSCGFKNRIWLSQEPDPAVLYNADGQEVSRYPKP